MQLWSPGNNSLVDFADGYSYLSFMPTNYGMRPENLESEQVSTILHEFSHQLTLRGPFGWLCAYFQSVIVVGRYLADLRARLELPAVFVAEIPVRDQEYVSLESFYEKYSDCRTNFIDLISTYSWLLEGIALFVQFDFRLSREHAAASDLFWFACYLVHSSTSRVTESATD